jgi:hypothetical protein
MLSNIGTRIDITKIAHNDMHAIESIRYTEKKTLSGLRIIWLTKTAKHTLKNKNFPGYRLITFPTIHTLGHNAIFSCLIWIWEEGIGFVLDFHVSGLLWVKNMLWARKKIRQSRVVVHKFVQLIHQKLESWNFGYRRFLGHLHAFHTQIWF